MTLAYFPPKKLKQQSHWACGRSIPPMQHTQNRNVSAKQQNRVI